MYTQLPIYVYFRESMLRSGHHTLHSADHISLLRGLATSRSTSQKARLFAHVTRVLYSANIDLRLLVKPDIQDLLRR